MRYLVNRKTKEHKAATREDLMLVKEFGINSDVFDLVQADSEGWIPHTGKECPLPDDARCEVTTLSGSGIMIKAGRMMWSTVVRYRPILTEQAEPTPALKYDPRSVSFNLIDRLKAAHEAAAKIPDIIAQIKAELEKYGHTVVPLNPFAGAEFVEPTNSTAVVAEPEAAVDALQDMTDWRNWREGDLLTCIQNGSGITVGHNYELLKIDSQGDPEIKRNNFGETDGYFRRNFLFHSRPARGG